MHRRLVGPVRHVARQATTQPWKTITLRSSTPALFRHHALEEIAKVIPDTTVPSSVAFVALSKTLPIEILGAVVSLLQQRALATSSHLIGSLCGPLANQHSLALALFSPTDGNWMVPFRSTIQGRSKIALGREIRRDMDEERNDWFHREHSSTSFQSPWRSEVLPELQGIKQEDIQGLWFLSDDKPEGLLSSLDHHLPTASKFGLIASSTPFVNGRPFALFNETAGFDHGALGLAFCSKTPRRLHCNTFYQGYDPLSGPLEITEAQGNIITSLNGQPATRLLLDLIEQDSRHWSKDSQFFLERLGTSNSDPAELFSSTHHRILSGDPSKGVMAIDTEDALPVGSTIRLQNYQNTLLSIPEPAPGFTAVTLDDTLEAEDGMSGSVSLDQRWLGASEHGFVASSVGKTRVTRVPHSLGQMN